MQLHKCFSIVRVANHVCFFCCNHFAHYINLGNNIRHFISFLDLGTVWLGDMQLSYESSEMMLDAQSESPYFTDSSAPTGDHEEPCASCKWECCVPGTYIML